MKVPVKSVEQAWAMAIVGGRSFGNARVLVVALLVVVSLLPAMPRAMGSCGCMDVAFVVDDTGSMGGALENVQTALPSIIAAVVAASGGNLHLGLVTFPDDNVVVNQAFTNGVTAVQTAIQALSAGGGNGEPESSDEALQYVVTGAADESCTVLNGPFGAFRAQCVKIAVLITDAHPGECSDSFTAGVTDVHAHSVAVAAADAGIRVAAIYVPTNGEDPVIKAIMQDYATTSHGQFLETASDGTGTGEGISRILAACGRGGGNGGCSSASDLLTQVDALGLSRSQTKKLEREVAIIGKGVARRNALAARTNCGVLGRLLAALVRTGRISSSDADSIASCCESLAASASSSGRGGLLD